MKYPYRRRLSIDIPEELHKQLSLLAKIQGKSLSVLVRMTLVKLVVTDLFHCNDK